MTKRILFILTIVVVLVAAVAVSCGPKPAPTTPAPAQTSAAPATTTTAAPKPSVTTTAAPATTTTAAPKPSATTTPAQTAQVFKWKLQQDWPDAYVVTKSGKRVADWLNKVTGGRLVLESVPAGAITPANKSFEGVNNGQVPVAFTYDAFNLYLNQSFGLFSGMVAGLTGTQQMLWYFSGQGDALKQELMQSYKVVSVANGAFLTPEIWAHSTKQIKSLADIKGWKVRTSGDSGEILTKIGASTVLVAGGEIYESLKRGVIDGAEYGTPSGNWDMAFHEAAKYVITSPSRAPGGGHGWYVAKADWDKLPADLQTAFIHIVKSESALFYTEVVAADSTAMAKYKQYGSIVEALPKDVEDALLAAAKTYYDDKSAKDTFFGKVVKSQRDYKALLESQGIL